ncbi:MAG: hypothetical protein H7X95_05275, partial [Deltaproteobacteria bacterium]|nr:hypothetical protein [Deltaproteobacteria bacterium]
HHLGRETFLVPVTWDSAGWPVFGDVGAVGRVDLRMRAPASATLPPKPMLVHRQMRGDRDDFDRSPLAPCWNFVRNPRDRDWSLTQRPGFLRLMGSPVTLDEVDSPALVVRRQQHFAVRCRSSVDFWPRRSNEEAGLVIRANERFHYQLSVTGAPARSARAGAQESRQDSRQESQQDCRQVVLRARIRGVTRVMGRVPILGPGSVLLQVDATRHWYTFRAGVAQIAENLGAKGRATRMRALGKLPTAGLSSESVWASGQNYFTGVFVGLFATGNGRRSTVPADFDWFAYVPVARR